MEKVNTQEPKILEICLSPHLGGLELFLYHCYNHFKNNTQCHVVIEKNKKLDNYFESDDKLYLTRNKLLPIIPAIQLAKYIDRYDIDILHFHWTRDMMTVVLAQMLSKKKPKIIQSRHMGMTRFKNDLYHRWLYKHISTIHAITKEVKGQLQKFIPQDIQPDVEVVYLGVKAKKDIDVTEIKQRYHIKNDEFVLCIVGRIQEGKDQHRVIEALSMLPHKNIKLFIVGESMDESYSQRLYKMCKEYNIEDRVIFTGFTKEVDNYMAVSDVAILATKNEAFGLVIIEAMANKTPVIATNRGGPLEIIDDGVDGLLYDGTAQDLAKKIDMLYNNRDLLVQLAQKSYKKANEKFLFSTQLQKLYNLIKGMK